MDVDGCMLASCEALESVAGGRIVPLREEFGISSIVGVERYQNLVAFLISMIGVVTRIIERREHGSGCHWSGPIAVAGMVG